MPGFERAATIDRPPSQVYAVLDDIHAARNWMPAIRRIEVLTPSDAVDVGFRWRETRRVMGVFRMSAELEVVEHDAPRTWGLKYEDKKMRATATFQLARNESGTLITMRQDAEDLQGKPKRAQRMAKWMEKADDDLLLRLKAYCESQPVREEPAEPIVHEPADSHAVQAKAPKARKKAAKKAKGKAKKAKAAPKAMTQEDAQTTESPRDA
jgi:uncharacterized protein YndB with AHSA1/START domain